MNIFFSEPKNFELQELYSNTYQHYIELTSKCYFKNIHPIFDKILFNTLLTTECYIIKNSLENNKINIPPILCKTIKKHTNKAIYFKVITSERCLAIFKIPFSRNNKFLDNNNQKCETFRVQYYFHGCVVEKNENYIKKK